MAGHFSKKSRTLLVFVLFQLLTWFSASVKTREHGGRACKFL